MVSKSTSAAKYVYAPLAANTDFHCGSIDTNFDPPQFPLDSTFKLKTIFLFSKR
jgi:hypothetical protein